MARKRLIDIDKAKGFAIFLVVLGHIISGGTPGGNDWFVILTQAIYRFHMPLFMCLSGIIYYYTFKPFDNINEYLSYLKKKAGRLLPGFFLIGFLVLLGKFIASKFIVVARVEENFLLGIFNLFVDPSQSAAGSLWYVYVLFEYYLIFPILFIVFRKNLYLISLFTLVLYLFQAAVPVTQYFLLERFMECAFFFSLGFIFISNYEYLTNQIKKYAYIFILLFAASFYTREFIDGDYNALIISIFSIPAIYALVNFSFWGSKIENSLLVLADYTFSIYLFNTIFIGLTKGIMFKFISWDGQNFFVFLPILLFAGIFFSIWLQKYILAKSSYLNKITK
jgi:fucose 4-O-acetylase-like acetyltransferase